MDSALISLPWQCIRLPAHLRELSGRPPGTSKRDTVHQGVTYLTMCLYEMGSGMDAGLVVGLRPRRQSGALMHNTDASAAVHSSTAPIASMIHAYGVI